MLNIALATAACAMISCIEENHPHIDQSTSNLVDMTLTAGTEDVESKVAFDAENYPKFTWTENDEISILGANSGNQKFTTTSAGASVIFSGKAAPSDEILYAVYPYDANIKIPAEGENGTNKDAELIKITIPAVQTATAGSFDPKAYTAVAKFNAGDDKITFRGIVSFMKFRLAQPENIKSVTITAHENQTISVTAGVKFDNNNVPTHGLSGTWSNGTSSVKLIESPLGDQFEKDTDYFIVTRANACPKGITISIEYDNGETYSTRSTNNQI